VSDVSFVYCEKMALLFCKINSVEAKAWLDKLYLDSAPAKSTVEKWFANLKRSRMCIEGDARSGRPKETVTDENIKKRTCWTYCA
jgi:hypothetical protein